MSERRVVVTGLGVVTPVGNDVKTFWESLITGRSGIRRYKAFDSEIYDCKIAGEVADFEPAKYFKSPKDARRADRFTQFAMAAAKMTMSDSGIDLTGVDHDRFGVMIGSGIGGLRSMEDECRRSVRARPLPGLALHDRDDDQQHGQRPRLHGVRPSRAKHVDRHRLRYREPLDR